MESKNPFFKTKTFSNTSAANDNVSVIDYNETMTVSGTINKSFILLMLLVATAFITWNLAFNGYNPIVLTIGGAIIGLILVKSTLNVVLLRIMVVIIIIVLWSLISDDII